MEPKQLININYTDWSILVMEKYPLAKIDGSTGDTFYAFLPEDFEDQYSYKCLGGFAKNYKTGWVM